MAQPFVDLVALDLQDRPRETVFEPVDVAAQLVKVALTCPVLLFCRQKFHRGIGHRDFRLHALHALHVFMDSGDKRSSCEELLALRVFLHGGHQGAVKRFEELLSCEVGFALRRRQIGGLALPGHDLACHQLRFGFGCLRIDKAATHAPPVAVEGDEEPLPSAARSPVDRNADRTLLYLESRTARSPLAAAAHA